MSLFNYKGKKAVVTGASSGLGVQFAKALAAEGVDVAVLARRVEKLEALAKEIEAMGVKCIPVKCDVSDEKSVEAAFATVVEKFGTIDILVNNAGVVGFSQTLETHSKEEWDKVINVDLTGVFLCSRAVSKLMKANKSGRIINTASIAGLVGGPAQFGYYAAKAGVVNLTRSLAAEFGPYGVTVNAIAPGVFESEMTEGMLEGPAIEALTAHNPMKRIGKNGELNSTLLYFASDASSYVTGQTVAVDGGHTSVL